MDRQRNAMHSSPDDEIPAGTMPEATQQHGGKQIEIGADPCLILLNDGRQQKDQ